MKTTFLAALTVLLVAPLAFAAGTVDVYIDGAKTPKTLTDAAHLGDLVAQPRLANSWWPGAVIAEKQASAVAQQQKLALLAQLDALAADESGEDAAATRGLRQQLEALNVTGRQFVSLDPDRVRLGRQRNPPLEGHYSLWVNQQPATITVFGLVSRPGKTAFVPEKDVTDYLDGMDLLSGADRSYAWVVYPDGRREKAPVAYWNKRHIEPMPGSIIFVGFADSLWTKKYADLNAALLRALAQRIPE
ncbi:capsule biosynthesis GfcC D2 domain-containing protein [Enterobacter sp. CC120223-11]|uniref:capsule biosynthesis GfcC D2 domain-containing protein n=1 Tax=Enterobacter sp. CC120223-11 TaxID=1378073 RepID=UPI000BD0340C|nr:capsule biosynthesis GfcC D2 domain-containing protein [Enterobacter sp. CC120223-11]SNY73032.1 Capsule biosynthesis GfcC [Enterobacter sp. CC120223-11]